MQSTEQEPEIHTPPPEGEIVDDSPSMTVNALALKPGTQGLEALKTRTEIVRTLREHSIAMTDPQDWTLFKKPESQGGLITAFLEDKGCQRIKPLWGIDVVPQGWPENSKFAVEKLDIGDEFLITVTGDSYCKLTDSWVRGVEGSRGSDEDFAKQQTGTRRLAHVRKAAFANLDGGCVRKQTGLSGVALQELVRAWKPLGKDWNQCNKGRGFGGAEKNYGTGDTGAEPKCPKCQGPMKLITPKPGASWSAFWGCKKGKDECKGSVQDADWQKVLAARKADAPEAAQSTQEPAGREPGDDSGSEHGTDKPEKLGEKKNRLGDLLKASKLPDARKQELRSAIIGAKTVEELIDVEAAITEVF
jgi:hypothetical protein